ncbi:MAG: hypothetical protein AAF531_25750 [Actinomycetota bacterium]
MSDQDSEQEVPGGTRRDGVAAALMVIMAALFVAWIVYNIV